MSGTRTENLGLFNTDMQTDGDDFFDFDRDLNQNNNILDAAIGKLSTLTTEEKSSLVVAINELVAGKSSIDLDNLSAIGQAIMDKKVEVEALLQQNGYAKFTWKENNQISILLCWGYGSLKSGNNTINFPVSYTVQRTVVVSKLYSAATTSDTVDVFEKAPTALENFKIYSSYNGFDFYWIAIGY